MMFRRLSHTLPPDFDFPETLDGLGYFINENDQIRMIEQPEQPFHYWISRNERYTERHREAFQKCIRKLLQERILSLGLNLTRLPLGTPLDKRHVPIWVSSNIFGCKRLIVYIGESKQDLGVFAGRIINNEGINAGSAVDFVNTAQSSVSGPLPVEKQPGIVIANPGQLLWHRAGKRALTWESWYALKRSSAVGPPFAVTDKNKIPDHETVADHVASVFKDVVLPQANHAEVFVIAVGDTAHDVFDYLQANWQSCAGKIKALTILASNYVWQTEFHDEAFMKWFGERARAYVVSGEGLGTPLQGRSRFGCNVYSGGESQHVECLMRSAHPAVLDYFKLISQIPDYTNPPQETELEPASEQETEEQSGWGVGESHTEATGKAPTSTGETEGTKEAPANEPTKDASVQKPFSALTEGLARLDLSPTPGPSQERPKTPVLSPVDQHTPMFAVPQSHEAETSPTVASEYSEAPSHIQSGYFTPPERVMPSVEHPVHHEDEIPVEHSVVNPLNGLRVLDINSTIRGRSISGASWASTSADTTASPPPPPAVPNSTPELGTTPESGDRIGMGGNGGSFEDGQGIGGGPGTGMGHGSLIREVLRFGDNTPRGAHGLDEAGGKVLNENESGSQVNGHDSEGTGKADG